MHDILEGARYEVRVQCDRSNFTLFGKHFCSEVKGESPLGGTRSIEGWLASLCVCPVRKIVGFEKCLTHALINLSWSDLVIHFVIYAMKRWFRLWGVKRSTVWRRDPLQKWIYGGDAFILFLLSCSTHVFKETWLVAVPKLLLKNRLNVCLWKWTNSL